MHDHEPETGHLALPRPAEASAKSSRAIRVFIADDHSVVRDGVRQILEAAGDFVVEGQAASGTAAIRGIHTLEPDLAVIDVRMPGGDGVEVVRELRAHGIRTRCVMLTSFSDESLFFECMVAGAVGYLLKDCTPEQLVDACRRAAAGENLVNRDVLDSLRARRATLPEDTLFAELSPQERRILVLVTHGLTNREIAEKLHLAEKTVRNYVSAILGKIGMKNRTQAAAYVARTATRRSEHGTVAAASRGTAS